MSSSLAGRVSPTTAKTSLDTDPPVLPTVPEMGPVLVVHAAPELLPVPPLLPPELLECPASLEPELVPPELPPELPPEPPPEEPPLPLDPASSPKLVKGLLLGPQAR